MVSEVVDSAARYLLYKLYDATAGRPEHGRPGQHRRVAGDCSPSRGAWLDHHPG